MPRFSAPSSGGKRKPSQRGRKVSFGITQTWTYSGDRMLNSSPNRAIGVDALLGSETPPLPLGQTFNYEYNYIVTRYSNHLSKLCEIVDEFRDLHCDAMVDCLLATVDLRTTAEDDFDDASRFFEHHRQRIDELLSQHHALATGCFTHAVGRLVQKTIFGAGSEAQLRLAENIELQHECDETSRRLGQTEKALAASNASIRKLRDQLEGAVRQLVVEKTLSSASEEQASMKRMENEVLSRELQTVLASNLDHSRRQIRLQFVVAMALNASRRVAELSFQTCRSKEELFFSAIDSARSSKCDASSQTTDVGTFFSVAHFARVCGEEFSTARLRGAVVGRPLDRSAQIQLCARLGLPPATVHPVLMAPSDIEVYNDHVNASPQPTETIIERTSMGSVQLPNPKRPRWSGFASARQRTPSPGAEERDRQELLRRLVASEV